MASCTLTCGKRSIKAPTHEGTRTRHQVLSMWGKGCSHTWSSSQVWAGPSVWGIFRVHDCAQIRLITPHWMCGVCHPASLCVYVFLFPPMIHLSWWRGYQVQSFWLVSLPVEKISHFSPCHCPPVPVAVCFLLIQERHDLRTLEQRGSSVNKRNFCLQNF